MSRYVLARSCVTWLLVFGALALISCKKAQAPVEAGGASIDFTLNDLNGNSVRLSDLKGKVVMLEFWATWCPPCRDAVPEMNALYEKYRDRGFVLLGLSLDRGADVQAALGAFAKEFSVAYPILHDNKEVSAQYGVYSIPSTILIDREGKVVERHVGFNPRFGETLSKQIEVLL